MRASGIKSDDVGSFGSNVEGRFSKDDAVTADVGTYGYEFALLVHLPLILNPFLAMWCGLLGDKRRLISPWVRGC